jgi:Mrp family chromosome partitioning ATPase
MSVYLDPKGMIADLFRKVAESIAATHPCAGCIWITSANDGEGKTLCACNLAIALAETGRRVLLVDANTRRPALRRLFDLPGLNGWNDARAEFVVARSDVDRLDLLPHGNSPVCAPDRLDVVVKSLRADYDQIVIDGDNVGSSNGCSPAGVRIVARRSGLRCLARFSLAIIPPSRAS